MCNLNPNPIAEAAGQSCGTAVEVEDWKIGLFGISTLVRAAIPDSIYYIYY